MKKYKDIVKKIIKKSFPKLRNKKIIFCKLNLGKTYSAGVMTLLPFLRIMFIYSKAEKLNEKELIGLFAHELSHFEIENEEGWIKTTIKGNLYWLIPKIREKIEKNTDKLAIKKGYARELYKLAKKVRHKNKKISKYYLSAEEIKSYAKSIKKW